MGDIDAILAVCEAHDPRAAARFCAAMAVDPLPDKMARAYVERALDDPAFVVETLTTYFDGDAATRADIEAFFDCDGPCMIQKSIDGTPTPKDLAEWAGG